MIERHTVDIIWAYIDELMDYVNGVDKFEFAYVPEDYRKANIKMSAAFEILDQLADAGIDVSRRKGA